MDKGKFKFNIENFIIAEVLANFSLMPYLAQRVDFEDFSYYNRGVLAKLNSFVGEDKLPEEIFISLRTVEGFNGKMFQQLSCEVLGTEKRLRDNIELFYEILTSMRIDEICKFTIEKNKDNHGGVDALQELSNQLKPLDEFFGRFKVEKVFSDRIDEIIVGIEKDMADEGTTSLKFNSLPSFSNLFRPTNLVGIAGAYKAGKTSLGLELICDLAAQGVPVGIMELEMSQDELDLKILARQTGISYFNLRNPKKLTDSEKNKIAHYKATLRKLPIYIDDSVSKMAQIESKCRYWAENYGVKAILVDYWGLIMPTVSKAKDNREAEMSRHSTAFKVLTKELKIVTLLLAQLNRSGVDSPDSRNMGESIAIARDADFLYVISHPSDILIKGKPTEYISLEGQNINIDSSHFLCNLDRSRHSANNKLILMKLGIDGSFKEICTQYDSIPQTQPKFNEPF